MQPDINAHVVPSADGDGDGRAVAGPEAMGQLKWSSPVSTSLEWHMSGGALTVRLGGEVCTWSVRRIEPVLHAVVTSLDAGMIEVDLSDVTFFDARGVSVLVGLEQWADERRRSYQIVGSSEVSRRVLAAAGFATAGAVGAIS